MKNLTTPTIILVLLAFSGLACKNPLTAYTKQYTCELPGEAEPANAEEYIDRAYRHSRLNNYRPDPGGCALGACSEAVRLDPKNPDAYYCRASAHLALEEYDKSLVDINEGIRLKADFPQAYYQRAVINDRLNKTEDAVADVSKSIELYGDKVEGFHYGKRGELYVKLGRYEEAVTDLTEAIRRDPDRRFFYEDRAKAYEKLGKNNLRVADLNTVAEMKEKETPTPPIDKTVANSNADPNMVSGGNLNSKALSIPKPVYPPAARAVRARSNVIVRVVVDETGNVISASAISGHPLLKPAAEEAAKGAKFDPVLANGKRVKVSGQLNISVDPD